MGIHLMQHGDGVKDVSFAVEDLDAIIERAKAKECHIDKDIWEESDQFGKVSSLRLPVNNIICFIIGVENTNRGSNTVTVVSSLNESIST